MYTEAIKRRGEISLHKHFKHGKWTRSSCNREAFCDEKDVDQKLILQQTPVYLSQIFSW